MAKIVDDIKKAKIVTRLDLARFKRLTAAEPVLRELSYRYHTSTRLGDPNTRFVYIKEAFYPLPEVEDDSHLAYALIDQLLYEHKRHDWTEEPCVTLRLMVKRQLGVYLFEDSDRLLRERLEAFEEHHRTHFGQYLSSDSDSAEERHFSARPLAKRREKIAVAQKDCQKAFAKKTGVRHLEINRPEAFNAVRAEADLAKINEKLARGEALTNTFLSRLTYRYVVAQYRGIHYFTTSWDRVGRRLHRNLDELNQPQFSSAVFAQQNIKRYHDYLTRQREEPELLQELMASGKAIQDCLIRLMGTNAVQLNKDVFISLFHLLQYWYSVGYDTFCNKIEADLQRGEASHFRTYLQSTDRPLLSTADTPRHALYYSYGLKVYEGHEYDCLRPRWRSDGRAERPYAGKVYISLHPITDYVQRQPSHVASLFQHGLIPLNNLIAAERETSFLGYLPEDRVKLLHVSKYPSFKGRYKKIYQYKYGMSEAQYLEYKQLLISADHAPNTKNREKLLQKMGTAFCDYHEIKLIREATQLAQAQGCVLVYRDLDGGFSLTPPPTPTARSKLLHDGVMEKRNKYRELAIANARGVNALTRDQFATKTARWPAALKASYELRLFGKQRLYNPAKPIKLPVITQYAP